MSPFAHPVTLYYYTIKRESDCQELFLKNLLGLESAFVDGRPKCDECAESAAEVGKHRVELLTLHLHFRGIVDAIRVERHAPEGDTVDIADIVHRLSLGIIAAHVDKFDLAVTSLHDIAIMQVRNLVVRYELNQLAKLVHAV